MVTILVIPLSAAHYNLEADWAEASVEVILRRCPICLQDSIIGHGRRRKQAMTSIMIGSGFGVAFVTCAERHSPCHWSFPCPCSFFKSGSSHSGRRRRECRE